MIQRPRGDSKKAGLAAAGRNHKLEERAVKGARSSGLQLPPRVGWGESQSVWGNREKDQPEAFWREEGGSRSRRETHPLKGGEVKAGGRGKESGEEHK